MQTTTSPVRGATPVVQLSFEPFGFVTQPVLLSPQPTIIPPLRRFGTMINPTCGQLLENVRLRSSAQFNTISIFPINLDLVGVTFFIIKKRLPSEVTSYVRPISA